MSIIHVITHDFNIKNYSTDKVNLIIVGVAVLETSMCADDAPYAGLYTVNNSSPRTDHSCAPKRMVRRNGIWSAEN